MCDIIRENMRRYVTIGRYEYSIFLLLIIAITCPLAFAATYYLWTSKTSSFTVEEPLTVTEFPTEIRFTPGENSTLNIVIANSGTIDYQVQLIITLSDAAYQQSYVQVSNYTYTVTPGNNTISAWIAVTKDAPPANHQLNVDFLRY
jgi:uncharacterized membrane protein